MLQESVLPHPHFCGADKTLKKRLDNIVKAFFQLYPIYQKRNPAVRIT